MDTSNVDKQKVIEIFEKRFLLQEKSLSIILESLHRLDNSAPEEIKMFWNIAGFINIIEYDIKIISCDLAVADRDWKKRHYARQACLIIFESIDSLFELFGKDFKNSASQIEREDFIYEVKSFSARLREFKKRNYLQLKKVRNTSVAHRDKDSLAQFASIAQIDSQKMLNITLEFDGILADLQKFLHRFMQEKINLLDFGK
jgi:hypothetical protein